MIVIFWEITPCGSYKNRPWRWRRYDPPKRWFLQEPHGVISQKMTIIKIHPDRSGCQKLSVVKICIPCNPIKCLHSYGEVLFKNRTNLKLSPCNYINLVEAMLRSAFLKHITWITKRNTANNQRITSYKIVFINYTTT
jgi:hypothetical protein